MEAKLRLDKLINIIIPSAKELHRILKTKRRRERAHDRPKARKEKKDKDFTYDDENIIYVIILKILESYHLEFSLHTRARVYTSEYIPLALEFYRHHVSPSDLILVNSMVRNLNIYFPNLIQSRSLVTREEYVRYYQHQRMTYEGPGKSPVSPDWDDDNLPKSS